MMMMMMMMMMIRSIPPLPKSTRTCVKLFDLHEHNLNFLRICVANFDWRPLFESTDIDDIYSLFLNKVRALIEHCIPVKYVRLGPRDPSFVTPLVKSLLRKRLYLRKRGRNTEADELAVRIKLTNLSGISVAGS